MQALSVIYAVEISCVLYLHKNIFELGSQAMIEMLNEKNLDGVSWQVAMLLKTTLMLSDLLDFVSFANIPWELNRVVYYEILRNGKNVSDKEQFSLEYSQVHNSSCIILS